MTTSDDQGPMDTAEDDSPAGVSCAAAAGYVIEKDSISETLLEIAAKHGNKASIDIVASYAAHLTDAGRDALIMAIGEGYSPTRFADYSHTKALSNSHEN